MRSFIVSLFVLFFPLHTLCQDNPTEYSCDNVFKNIEYKSHHKIRIQQDSSISNLIMRHIEKNKRNPGIEGYRIRIYADLGTHAREESEEVKAEFYEKFPEIPVYRRYDDRWYKVYVGDFRSKVEAIKSLKRIRKEYPSAFVVSDKINFPELN